MTKLWQPLRSSDGSEIGEVAVILPIVLTLLMAILWFGRAYNVYTTITHAAREGANVMVHQSCATCGGATPTASDVAARVGLALTAAGINPNNVQVYTPNPAPTAGNCSGGMATGTSNRISVFSNAQLNALSSNIPACGVIVSFQYPFNFFLLNPIPPFGRNSFTLQLKADVQMQGEN